MNSGGNLEGNRNESGRWERTRFAAADSATAPSTVLRTAHLILGARPLSVPCSSTFCFYLSS